jgi:hypothetical protein
MTRILTCVPLLLALLAACGTTRRQVANIAEFDPEIDVVIAAGEAVELNLDVPASSVVAGAPVDAIEVVFQANAPIDWNIHVHPRAGEVRVLQQGTNAAGILRHTPSNAGPISVLWQNRTDAPVEATLRLDSVPAGTTGEWHPKPQ